MSLSQIVTIAPPSTKIRCAILCTALADALGGPAEFHRRFKFPFVDRMLPNANFNLPKGVWTDDTSMALCLARSIASDKGFDEEDQLAAYTRWWTDGVLSATGNCFDIGNTIRQAVAIYAGDLTPDALKMIKQSLGGEVCSGNGSLMRVIPVGVLYWRDEKEARELARRSSLTTHPNDMCQEACEVWTGAVVRIMRAAANGETMTKRDVLHYFSEFPYQNAKLRQALAYTADDLDANHPIMKVILGMKEEKLPEEDILPSTGYVLHTLVAALFCFLSTDTYDAGAIRAANLGSDADTVAAVYGGLAGCWYGTDADEDKTFWTLRLDGWYKDLVKKDVIKAVTEELVAKEQALGNV
ncbi:ADP-ribosylglycohydrolase [Hymenopellis radicata]|nr:ADP-ribosylglycohydrolase [Hymenopellis radicata]